LKRNEGFINRHWWVIGIAVLALVGSSIWTYQDLTGFKLSKLKLADVAMATCQISGYQNCSEDPKTGAITHGACFDGYVDNGSICTLIHYSNPPQSSYDPKVGCPTGSTYNGQICVYTQQAQYGVIPVSASSAPAGTGTCQFQSFSLLKPSLLAVLCIPKGTPPTTTVAYDPSQSSGISCLYGTDIYGKCNPAPSNTGATTPSAPTPTIFNNGQSCVAAGGYWSGTACQVPVDVNVALQNVQKLIQQSEAQNQVSQNNASNPLNPLIQKSNTLSTSLANNNQGGLDPTTLAIINNPLFGAVAIGLVFTLVIVIAIAIARKKKQAITTQ
jgi:hypothetical protein